MNLYHYADQNGFMGIIENKEIWATKIQYLNDENEYKLALRLAKNYLVDLLSNETSAKDKARLDKLIKSLKRINDINICVCSLSEQGDLLSQWRGYSSSLGGYSIGFSSEKLEVIAEREGIKLIKCIYDSKEQRSLIKNTIDMVLKADIPEPELASEYYDFSERCDLFSEKLSEISPLIKDASFIEEAEWRLISTRSFDELSFRSGRSMLIPFYKIPLKISMKELITEIVIGHTPHAELAVKSTEAFLVKSFPPADGVDYSCKFKVSPSSIPFRNW